MPTRVTLVAGFLGAGKTSVIQHLLTQQSYQGKTAVLVNEIGAVGIDGALIQETSGKECYIKEMAGGCICCSANLPFRQAVVELLRRKPDRLIVEPTGVAAVSSVRQVFEDPGIAPSVSVDPLLVVVDPRHWDAPHIRAHPLYQEQQSAAEVLAMSHRDLCDQDLIERFAHAHQETPLVIADHGKLRANWTELANPSKTTTETESAQAVSAKGITQQTITWPEGHVLPLREVQACWQQAAAPSSVLRCKGIIHSNEGWVAVQSNGQMLDISPAAADQQSRLVTIMLEETAAEQWWQHVHKNLLALGHHPAKPS